MNHQNASRSASCNCRFTTEVVLITPKPALPTVLPGLPNWGWFRNLYGFGAELQQHVFTERQAESAVQTEIDSIPPRSRDYVTAFIAEDVRRRRRKVRVFNGSINLGTSNFLSGVLAIT